MPADAADELRVNLTELLLETLPYLLGSFLPPQLVVQQVQVSLQLIRRSEIGRCHRLLQACNQRALLCQMNCQRDKLPLPDIYLSTKIIVGAPDFLRFPFDALGLQPHIGASKGKGGCLRTGSVPCLLVQSRMP